MVLDFLLFFFFFNDTATTEIYTTHNTLSLHDALPISRAACFRCSRTGAETFYWLRSEEHTSELQSLCVISYAVFCLKKKKKHKYKKQDTTASNIRHKHLHN